LFGFIQVFLLLFSVHKSCVFYFSSCEYLLPDYKRLLGVCFLYFFMLSMIGGDIEQNRNLLLMSASIYVIRLKKNKEWKFGHVY